MVKKSTKKSHFVLNFVLNQIIRETNFVIIQSQNNIDIAYPNKKNLVCYSTLSRIVHDQSILIGMKKAQGFSTGKIILPFIIYSELAAVIGILIGITVGYYIIEPITVNSTKQSFMFGEFVPYHNISDIIFILLLILFLVFITVFVACYNLSSKKAHILLVGEESENKKIIIGLKNCRDKSLKINFKDITNYDKIDTLILTVIGAVIGIVIGIIYGRMSLDSFNNNATHFLNTINIPACIIGVLFSLILSFIMCKITLKKIKNFDLSDISAD